MAALKSVEEAWPHFKGWRVNYESIAYARLRPAGPWTGRRRYPDENADGPQLPRRPLDRRPGNPEGERIAHP